LLDPENLGKNKVLTLDQLLRKIQLIQRRGPLSAAILDFTIRKYGHNQIYGFVGFVDPKNLGKDTTISLAHLLEE